MQRLDKAVSDGFLLSRLDAKKAIRAGRVTLDGEVQRDSGAKCPLEGADLRLDGQTPPFGRHIYIMMNKPAGLVSATRDKREQTVISLLPESFVRAGLAPAGRLDKDSEGLLILTNDGELNHRITSPKYHAKKVYKVMLDRPAEPEDVKKFSQGMDLGDFFSAPAQLFIEPGDSCLCSVTLGEGKFHQVKRMFEKCGKSVTYLKRVEMAGIRLDSVLESGQWRLFEPAEIVGLKAMLGILTK